MTVDTLIAAPVRLPSVNLLPPEIHEANTARRVKFGLALALVAVLGGMGYLYTAAGSSVTTAQSDLDAAKSTTANLTNQVAKHNTVGPLKKDVQQRLDWLSTAMGFNVRWAFFLNDVQMGLPRDARLVTWQMQLTPPPPGGAPATFGSAGVATWTITGEAKHYKDVALVVESLTQLDEVDSVFVTKAAEVIDTSSGQKLIQFSATARMNSKALFLYNPKVGR